MVISYDEANNNLLFAEIYNINNISKNIYVGYNSLIEDQGKFLDSQNIKILKICHFHIDHLKHSSLAMIP